MIAGALLLGPLLTLCAWGVGQEDLGALAAEGRWDDVIVVASERLEGDAEDQQARYWLGRAWLARGESLLTGGPSVFARDLARSSLDRAVNQLSLVEGGDAAEWLAYARFLRDDATLPADLEKWYAEEGHGYAAYLRGLVARRDGDGTAAAWLERAADAAPERSDFAMAWAEELATEGRRDEALAAWDRARRHGATTTVLLPMLLRLLPAPADAEARLERLEALATDRESDAFLAWYRAHTLQQLDRWEEAADVFAAADENRSPDTDLAYLAVLVRLGRGEDGIDRLRPWAEAGDRRVLANLLDLGDGLAQRRLWDRSLDCYDAVLAAYTGDERAARNRALTLSLAGRREPARAAWTALVAQHPGRADILNDAALMLRGAGAVEEARALWRQAVALKGDGVDDARENLAFELRQEAPDEARRLLGLVLAEQPDRDRALYLRLIARPSRSR